MKWRKCLGFIILLIVFPSGIYGQKYNRENAIVTSALGVVQRLLPDHPGMVKKLAFSFEGFKGNDTYIVTAKNGLVSVIGNSSVALSHGFYMYLRDVCHSMVGWAGNHLDLPAHWPDYEGQKIVCPYRYRYYLNVVTFGYTTPYWDWHRWEKELDWMALHGINMPLATVASEAIAQKVWLRLGLKKEDLNDFFTGPAYLPWHRMGNLNKWDGPLSDSWHRSQLALQHHIISRMRSLGMHPIAPAFAGFVPLAFLQKHSVIKASALKWGGFASGYNVQVMAPGTLWYERIGKLFVQEWEKEFGENAFYLSDSFNEMDVPVPEGQPEKKYALLAAYGESIYRSIKAGNPNAVWVTQGWTFGQEHRFWNEQALQSLLSKVPDNKMLVLDLANEYPHYVWHTDQVWKTHQGFYGKQWIYSYVPNFGGKTAYTGPMMFYASASAEALQSPYAKNLVGFGMAPEGIENNEVVYELLSDMGWSSSTIDLNQWIYRYSLARYGSCPAIMWTAWQELLHSCYDSFGSYPRFVWQTLVPDKRRKGNINNTPGFQRGVRDFLAASDSAGNSLLYQNDAIEMASIYLGIKADSIYQIALQADSSGNDSVKQREGAKAVEILSCTDRLLASHTLDRLDIWVTYARSQEGMEGAKRIYVSDAQRLITTWGGTVEDYAARIWSGLIRDYYIPRMQHYLADKSFDRFAWEDAWVHQPGISKVTPYAHPLKEAKSLVEKYK